MEQILINHLQNAFAKGEVEESKLPSEILTMDGMSGKKTRHFYNNLLDLSGARYLEIGTWKGSSLCSAMAGNEARVVCIDNWSYDTVSRGEFLVNFNRWKGLNQARYIEGDCFAVDASVLPSFNIYLYDGDHVRESHKKALTHFDKCLDSVFIYIVDDWNDKRVRDGTWDAIYELGYTVLYQKEIRLTTDNSHTPLEEAKAGWWNGVTGFVLQKE